jgi:excisionase family DNA binding protein
VPPLHSSQRRTRQMVDGKYTPNEVARRLDVDVATIYRWIRQRRLAALRLAGYRYLIRPEAVEALLSPAGRAETAGEAAVRWCREQGWEVGGAD